MPPLADAVDSVAWLLGAGASVNAHDQSGATALMLAAAAPRGAALDALLGAEADVKAVDQSGNTALHFASAMADTARVTKLLAAGATVNAANRDGDQPLDIALRADHATVRGGTALCRRQASRPATIRSSGTG